MQFTKSKRNGHNNPIEIFFEGRKKWSFIGNQYTLKLEPFFSNLKTSSETVRKWWLHPKMRCWKSNEWIKCKWMEKRFTVRFPCPLYSSLGSDVYLALFWTWIFSILLLLLLRKSTDSSRSIRNLMLLLF